jgi:hypothetical protein
VEFEITETLDGLDLDALAQLKTGAGRRVRCAAC